MKFFNPQILCVVIATLFASASSNSIYHPVVHKDDFTSCTTSGLADLVNLSSAIYNATQTSSTTTTLTSSTTSIVAAAVDSNDFHSAPCSTSESFVSADFNPNMAVNTTSATDCSDARHKHAIVTSTLGCSDVVAASSVVASLNDVTDTANVKISSTHTHPCPSAFSVSSIAAVSAQVLQSATVAGVSNGTASVTGTVSSLTSKRSGGAANSTSAVVSASNSSIASIFEGGVAGYDSFLGSGKIFYSFYGFGAIISVVLSLFL